MTHTIFTLLPCVGSELAGKHEPHPGRVIRTDDERTPGTVTAGAAVFTQTVYAEPLVESTIFDLLGARETAKRVWQRRAGPGGLDNSLLMEAGSDTVRLQDGDWLTWPTTEPHQTV